MCEIVALGVNKHTPTMCDINSAWKSFSGQFVAFCFPVNENRKLTVAFSYKWRFWPFWFCSRAVIGTLDALMRLQRHHTVKQPDFAAKSLITNQSLSTATDLGDHFNSSIFSTHLPGAIPANASFLRDYYGNRTLASL